MTAKTAAKPFKPVARAVIHDLGYKRYSGIRRPQATRWRVVMRNQIAHGWKTWWRYKAWIGVSVLITVVIGAIMAFARSDQLGDFSRNGMVMRLVDELALTSMQYYTMVGFLVSLTSGAGIVANDLRTGAFTFYFSRPVRTIDYLAGKLAGLFVLQTCVMALPMTLLVIVRLALSQNSDEIMDNLHLLPKIMLIGSLASLCFAAVSLGFSSLFRSQALSIGLWAGYYIVGYVILMIIAVNTTYPEIAAVDFAFALKMIAFQMFDLSREDNPVVPALSACVIGVLANITVGISLAYWRIRAAGHAGIGGS